MVPLTGRYSVRPTVTALRLAARPMRLMATNCLNLVQRYKPVQVAARKHLAGFRHLSPLSSLAIAELDTLQYRLCASAFNTRRAESTRNRLGRQP
jgi:hypothetical protein